MSKNIFTVTLILFHTKTCCFNVIHLFTDCKRKERRGEEKKRGLVLVLWYQVRTTYMWSDVALPVCETLRALKEWGTQRFKVLQKSCNLFSWSVMYKYLNKISSSPESLCASEYKINKSKHHILIKYVQSVTPAVKTKAT